MLYCLTADHVTAPLTVRERITPTANEVTDLTTRFSDPLVILSTCNRTEFYISSTRPEKTVLRELAQSFPVLGHSLDCFKWLADKEVVTHLFRVSAGLTSQILGEGQVLGQVKKCYERARLLKSLDSTLHRLFQTALSVGKQVRTETKISQGNVSLAGVAVETALKMQNVKCKMQNVAIVGTGETGQLIQKFLQKKKITPAIFGKFGQPLVEFYRQLAGFELIFIATRPRLQVLQSQHLTNRKKALTVFDLGMPRHVAPQIRKIPAVRLFDLSDLTDSISANLKRRKEAAKEAERIVMEAVTCHCEGVRRPKQSRNKNVFLSSVPGHSSRDHRASLTFRSR